MINPNARATTYHWEYGLEDCSESTCQQTPEQSIGAGNKDVHVRYELQGLNPGVTYHFRLVPDGEESGPLPDVDRYFTTYSPESGVDTCPNALARKQTGAA